MWGPLGVGRTTLALKAAAATCAEGGKVRFICFDTGLNQAYAAALGVPIEDLGKFRHITPETLEEGLKGVGIALRDGVDLIILDNLGQAIPAQSLSSPSENPIKTLGHIWADVLPALARLLAHSHTALLTTISVRKGLGQPLWEEKEKEELPWKYYSSVRIALERREHEVRAFTQKNAVGCPDPEGVSFRLGVE
jgi:RecA/RadA recombinase